MDMQFYDDPIEEQPSREDVRIKQIGLFMYPDVRRLAFGIQLTRFRIRPSIQVTITNGLGEQAGSLHVIEPILATFTLNMHLRDKETVNPYTLTAVVYFSSPEEERVDVDSRTIEFDATVEGKTLFPFEEQ